MSNNNIKILREFGLKHAEGVRQRIEAGEESEVQGLLEQWLRAGRMSQAEALMTSTDMFGAGVDTVIKSSPSIPALRERGTHPPPPPPPPRMPGY